MAGDDRYPFGPFETADEPCYGTFFVVNRLRGNPRYVVKELFDINLAIGVEKAEWMDWVVRDIRLVKRHLGAFMPKTELVIGEGATNAPTLFLVQERIEGSPIDPHEPVSEEMLAMLDRFVCQMVRMYGATYDASSDRGAAPETPYPHRGNILVGRRANRSDEVARPYLIDCYPILRLEPIEFQEMMRRWIFYLEDMQERIEGGWQKVPLEARRVCEDVLLQVYARQR
jgi:hypothetical protein